MTENVGVESDGCTQYPLSFSKKLAALSAINLEINIELVLLGYRCGVDFCF